MSLRSASNLGPPPHLPLSTSTSCKDAEVVVDVADEGGESSVEEGELSVGSVSGVGQGAVSNL